MSAGDAILVSGGRIVAEGRDGVGDLLIEHGRVAAIGPRLEAPAARRIDATGKYVLPGGVDAHTHLDAPGSVPGTTTVDDFTSGTVAAAFGGTTTLVDFCIQARGQTLADALATWHGKLERRPPVVDVGFHVAVTDLTVPGALEDLARLPEAGVTSYKLFMAYKGGVMVDDATLFEVLGVAADSGSLVLVHAENGDVIDVLVRRARAAGHGAARWHAATRPPLTEAEATSRAVMLARLAGAPLYVVHVSCREAAEQLARARAAEWRVWGETCPQYLFIDERRLDEPDGVKYVFTPPPRAREHQEPLWQALRDDVLSAVTSDHSPFHLNGMEDRGRDDFTVVPDGAPGIEDRLRLLHHFGVREGRISLPRLVELTATAPARLFGLYPRKGTLAVGADADVVVFDPARRVRVSAGDPRTHHSRVDHNLYEGTELIGAPTTVLVRGTVVVDGDELLAAPGHGAFVARARFGEELAVAGQAPAAVATTA